MSTPNISEAEFAADLVSVVSAHRREHGCARSAWCPEESRIVELAKAEPLALRSLLPPESLPPEPRDLPVFPGLSTLAKSPLITSLLGAELSQSSRTQ